MNTGHPVTRFMLTQLFQIDLPVVKVGVLVPFKYISQCVINGYSNEK